MRQTFLVGILGVIVLLVAAVFLVNRGGSESAQTSTPPTTTSNNNVQPTVDTATLRAGGSSYSDPQGVYTFLYPNDYTLDDQDPTYLRIYKQGEMQRPQSEMSDGVIIVFESIALQPGQSLETLVDARIQQATADQSSEIIQPKRATMLNNYPGFTYELRGLGTATNLFLHKDASSTSAVGMTFLIADPQQKGYQNEVESILATLELRK